MNQKKEKDETNGYRNTNGKESDDIRGLILFAVTQGYLGVAIQVFISSAAFGLSTVWNMIIGMMPKQESE